MRRFSLVEPSSAQEASQFLTQYGDDAQVYAGGTELLMLLKLGILHCEYLIALKRIPNLDAIRYDQNSGSIHIGALATHRDVEHSPVMLKHLPTFSMMEKDVANVRVRNVGTIAGNLCFADPYSDPGTLLTCLQAEVILQRNDQQRTLPIDSFFVDAYSTSREDDELLVEIKIPPLPSHSAVSYETFRFYERPSANVAVLASLGSGDQKDLELTIAMGAVPPVPTRLDTVKLNSDIDPNKAAEAADEACQSRIQDMDLLEDFHGSPEYKRNLLRVLLRRATASAVANARTQM